MPESIPECGECGEPNKNLKQCRRCGQGICPYCYEDGHSYNGQPCDGTVGEDSEDELVLA